MLITNEHDIIADISTDNHTRTRYGRGGEQYNLNVTLNYLGCTVQDLLRWASKERIVKFQRALRQMPNKESFRAFHEAGPRVEIMAQEANLPLSEHTSKEHIIQTLKDQL